MSPTTRRNQGHEHRIARKFIVFAMATAVAAVALLSPPALIRNVSAAPDCRDFSFGQNGAVFIWPESSITCLAVQPDGKILVAQIGHFGQNEFVVLDRYLQNSELEWRKLVPGTVGAAGASYPRPRLRVLVRPDGQIVVVRTKDGNSVIALFNSNGSVDGSFSSGGLLVGVRDVGVLPDNRLVRLNVASLSIHNTSGALVQTIPLPYISVSGEGELAVGKDGRIVTVYSNLMAVFNSDLTPDSSFCPGGLCNSSGSNLRIANDGKIILASYQGAYFFRYLPNGSVDTGFGTLGVFHLDYIGYDFLANFTVDDAGRVVAGMHNTDATDDKVWVIEVDGSSAERMMMPPGCLPDTISDIALQENGKLLVTGWRFLGNKESMLGRYHYADERTSGADLRFETTRTSPAATARRGHEITYTITVHNDGPAKAGHVTFENAIPNGTTFVSFEAPEGWVTYQQPRGFIGNKVSCSGYRLESGQSAEFQLTVRVNSTVAHDTQIINISQVSSLVPDPNVFNNTTFSTLTVQ